jgi:hypothetical protein
MYIHKYPFNQPRSNKCPCLLVCCCCSWHISTSRTDKVGCQAGTTPFLRESGHEKWCQRYQSPNGGGGVSGHVYSLDQNREGTSSYLDKWKKSKDKKFAIRKQLLNGQWPRVTDQMIKDQTPIITSSVVLIVVFAQSEPGIFFGFSFFSPQLEFWVAIPTSGFIRL